MISLPCVLPKQSRSKLNQMYLPTTSRPPAEADVSGYPMILQALAPQIASCRYSHSKKCSGLYQLFRAAEEKVLLWVLCVSSDGLVLLFVGFFLRKSAIITVAETITS